MAFPEASLERAAEPRCYVAKVAIFAGFDIDRILRGI